jgi:hypothetical protein
MKYVAYGAEQPESVKVMVDGETVHIRMARNYQPPDPNDDQSTGQWEETYQQIPAREAPTKEQVASDEETWWNRGEIWADTAKTLEDRISEVEALVKGRHLTENC